VTGSVVAAEPQSGPRWREVAQLGLATVEEFSETVGAEEKARVDDLRAVNSLARSQLGADPDAATPACRAWRAHRPDIVEPLVWRHPTGRRSLVPGATAACRTVPGTMTLHRDGRGTAPRWPATVPSGEEAAPPGWQPVRASVDAHGIRDGDGRRRRGSK
jgi:hypothetical protein